MYVCIGHDHSRPRVCECVSVCEKDDAIEEKTTGEGCKAGGPYGGKSDPSGKEGVFGPYDKGGN